MIDRIDTTDKKPPAEAGTNAGVLPGKQEILQFLDTVSELPRAASRADINLIAILQAVQELARLGVRLHEPMDRQVFSCLTFQAGYIVRVRQKTNVKHQVRIRGNAKAKTE